VPKFGTAAIGIAVVCKRHKTNEQVDVRSPLCAHPTCNKHPVFGTRTGGAPLFCKMHRREDYTTDCINRQCSYLEGCRRQASYGEWGSKAPLFCRQHKAAAHINIRKAWCIGAPGCRTQPSFGPRGGAALYCAAHRVAGHVNLVSRLCQHPDGCSRIPSFGEETDGVVKFCSAHRARWRPGHASEEQAAHAHAAVRRARSPPHRPSCAKSFSAHWNQVLHNDSVPYWHTDSVDYTAPAAHLAASPAAALRPAAASRAAL
jgi:hypothetical protein